MPQRLLLFLFLLSPWLVAQQSTNDRVLARAELAASKITIGDQIWLEVNVSAPPGTQVSGLAPGYITGLDGLEAIQEKEIITVAETPELLLQQRFLITSFDTGYIALPPLPFVFKAANGRMDTAYTNDLLLTVNALPVSDDEELRPIKPIIEEPLNLLDFWPLFLLLALGGLGYAVYVYKKRQKQEVPPPPPPPPADEVALAQLSELEQKNLWQNDQTKAYYSELTRILRAYLEGRFDVQAMEMTTRQITANLAKRRDFDDGYAKELGQLLQLSDLVKFAKARPAVELHPESLARVRSFVEATGNEPEPELPVADGLTFPDPVPAPSVAPATPPSEAEVEGNKELKEEAVKPAPLTPETEEE